MSHRIHIHCADIVLFSEHWYQEGPDGMPLDVTEDAIERAFGGE